jgi:hypothetical protein
MQTFFSLSPAGPQTKGLVKVTRLSYPISVSFSTWQLEWTTRKHAHGFLLLLLLLLLLLQRNEAHGAYKLAKKQACQQRQCSWALLVMGPLGIVMVVFSVITFILGIVLIALSVTLLDVVRALQFTFAIFRLPNSRFAPSKTA